ncbi:MAG TPA: trypsin-like peptidase domain-containing protein [Steroidobacteraceae bacterium]
MSTLKDTFVFLVKWAFIGLGVAFAVVLLRPELLRARSEPALQAQTQTPRRSFADAVAKAGPSVVNIYTARLVSMEFLPGAGPLSQDLPAVRRRFESSLGSGVIVDAQGHVITNQHVIENASEIRVQLADGRIATPVVVGNDPATDLALLRIDLPNLPVMTLGRSDELRPGDVVLAIGNPLGLSQTVTQGIVSATGRGNPRLARFADFIQTDAAINFGNSGGALINTEGELVGINTAVLAQSLGTEGIGFAIPVNLVRGVMEEILAHGRVRRGRLGVRTLGDPRLLRNPPVIGLVEEGSPAERAGLMVGDLITHLNDQPVSTDQEAMNRIASMPPGSEVKIRVRRNGKELELTAILEERPRALDLRGAD